MTLRLSTKHSECATITDKDHNTLACISTNTPGLPEKLIERFNAFEDGGLVGELVEALNFLLEQTVDELMNSGCELSDSEAEARNAAISILSKIEEAMK